jgi:hypothetical protein
MAPKQGRSIAGPRSSQPKGYAQAVLEELASPDNRSVLIAIGVFAVSQKYFPQTYPFGFSI